MPHDRASSRRVLHLPVVPNLFAKSHIHLLSCRAFALWLQKPRNEILALRRAMRIGSSRLQTRRHQAMKWAIRWAVLGAILALVPMAKADSTDLSFVLSGPTTASFDLPENPTVLASLTQFGFMVQPTDLIVNGTATTDLLFFYSATPMLDGSPITGLSGGVAGFLTF